MNVATVSIDPELNEIQEYSVNETNNKHVRRSNLKSHGSRRVDSTASNVPLTSLRADDIEEYRWWSLASCILCFFIIAPVVAFYHSRRVRKMKENQELVRARHFSERIHDLLMFSTIVGIIIWAAIIFVLVVLFVMGAVLKRI